MAVITISRQFGAGGRTLGKMIAKRLGYELMDEDIIQKVAEQARVSRESVKGLGKDSGGPLLGFMNSLVSKSYLERLISADRGYIDEDIYVESLTEVITKMANEGSVVIVGRGGQFILKDHPDAFHVLLIADEKDRIAFMRKHHGLSEEEASQMVETMGRRRANLYRKFKREKYDHPEHYHVVLNMSRLDLDKASELVFRMIADVVCQLVEG